MTPTIGWNIQVTVEGESGIAGGSAVDVTEYAKSRMLVEANSTRSVEIQSSSDNQIVFFVLNPLLDPNEQSGSALTYKVSDTDKEIVLQGMQLFDKGAVGLLGEDPQSLKFTNDTENPITVEMILGRGATADSSANGNGSTSDSASDSSSDNGNG